MRSTLVLFFSLFKSALNCDVAVLHIRPSMLPYLHPCSNDNMHCMFSGRKVWVTLWYCSFVFWQIQRNEVGTFLHMCHMSLLHCSFPFKSCSCQTSLSCCHMTREAILSLGFTSCHILSSFCNLWNLSGVNSCRHFSVSGIAIVYFNVHCILCSSYHAMSYLHVTCTKIKVMTRTIELKLNAHEVSWIWSFWHSFKLD